MTLPPDSGPEIVSDNVRRAALAQAIQQEVFAGGRVEVQGDFNAVIRFGKTVNHVLHLILTASTLGLWGLIWIYIAIDNHNTYYAVTLTVDEFGNLTRQSSNASKEVGSWLEA